MIAPLQTFFFSLLLFGSFGKKDPCPEVNDFEYHCPTNDGNILIHTKEEQISIDCPSHEENFEIQLPKLIANKTQYFVMYNCAWPQNSFKKIMERFSLIKIPPYLEFSGSSVKKIERGEDFKGLRKLKVLKLNENGIETLDGRIFLNTPKLHALDLSDNNIKLKEDVFNNLPLLEFLDLSLNGLEYLPPNVFRALKKLRTLHLWSNKLTRLDDSTFRNLDDLQSLELMMNKIDSISENAFKSLRNLRQINLSQNKLEKLPLNLFRHNEKLRTVLMEANFKLQLPDYFFANMFLTRVDLNYCNLGTIPEHIFSHSSSLKNISLKNNSLKYLPEILFEGLNNLERIDLQNNQIESISKVFTDLKRLKFLYLQNNFISTLAFEVVIDLVNLEEISLKNNTLTNIDARLFFDKKNLKVINLSYNGITTPFHKIIDMTDVPSLSRLDLSHNNISLVRLENFKPNSNLSLRLDYNPVTIVDFQNFDLVTGSTVAKISLKNSSIECDCRNHDFFEFLTNKKNEKYIIKIINIENSKCANLSNRNTCPLDKLSNYTRCPERCSCNWRPFDQSIVIDCSSKNLTKFPEIDLSGVSVKYNQTVVNFEKNDLTAVPDNLTGFDNITQLFFSNNKIRTISRLPPKLEILKLDHNHITNLDEDMVKQLNITSLVEVALHDNPWLCNCSSLTLATFLREHHGLFNRTDLRCANSDTLLIDLKEADLCPTWDLLYLMLIVLSVLLMLAISFALYYRYQQSIKIWLFAQSLCLWWVTEEELDKDKVYDVFISYSHKDEDFVVRNLIPELEAGPRPYKLCLHQRDWVPGEFIISQIQTSVEQSRRTLVVLSRNFLNSVWAKMEFRTAHTNAMANGRARVIIVLLEDVAVCNLDEELKAYLRTNTYVKWGDQFFWNKLKYALPHRKRAVPGSRQGFNANMYVWEDKHKLLGSAPSTPGCSSSSSLAKMNPFWFKDRAKRNSFDV